MRVEFSGDDLGNCRNYGPNGKGVEEVRIDVVNEPLKLFIHVWSAGGNGQYLDTTVEYVMSSMSSSARVGLWRSLEKATSFD